MADVDFFFDFISPYTYLARTQLDGIAARSGARFKIWPMHLPQSDEDRGQYSHNRGLRQQALVLRAGHRKVVRSLRNSVQDESSSSRRSQSDLDGCTGCTGNESGRAIQPSRIFRILDRCGECHGPRRSRSVPGSSRIGRKLNSDQGGGRRIRETPGVEHPVRCRPWSLWFADLYRGQ